ncbi:MAG: hypothetical protein GQ565_00135 [Candidatus Aegiribacteria sp.]|nr:hypothetical protein [Candidatus Aegiribacteria sp.]
MIFGTNPFTAPNSDFIPPDQWNEPVARAPIVYFYGEHFTGTFTVSVHSGSFIETLPIPESLVSTSTKPSQHSYHAVWNISSTSDGQSENTIEAGRDYPGILSELLEIWRKPPSFLLEFEDGLKEKFIYYECLLNPSSEDDFYPVLLQNNGAVLHPDYTGPVMRFVKRMETVNMELITEWPVSGQIVYNKVPNVPGILCDWARGAMKSEELVSMWDTWKTWIYDGSWSGDTLLVFPLPENTIEGMTTIILRTDDYREVEYSRFYLGILSN